MLCSLYLFEFARRPNLGQSRSDKTSETNACRAHGGWPENMPEQCRPNYPPPHRPPRASCGILGNMFETYRRACDFQAFRARGRMGRGLLPKSCRLGPTNGPRSAKFGQQRANFGRNWAQSLNKLPQMASREKSRRQQSRIRMSRNIGRQPCLCII